MTSTFVSTHRYFSRRAWVIASAIGVLACGGRTVLAQSSAPGGGFLEHEAVTPPLLFREVWQQPPHTGPLNDENRRITPKALTSPDLEYRLYGTDASNIQVTEHNGVPDPLDRLYRLARGTDAAPQERLPRSDGTHEDALEDAHGESARAASGREARRRHAAGREPDVLEPAEADGGINRLLGQFRGV